MLPWASCSLDEVPEKRGIGNFPRGLAESRRSQSKIWTTQKSQKFKNQKIEIFADEPGRAVDRGPHPLTTVLGNRRSDRATHAAVREALELGSPPAVVAAWVAGVRWLRQDGLVRRKGCSAEEGPSRVFPSYRNNPGWPFWGTFSVFYLTIFVGRQIGLSRGVKTPFSCPAGTDTVFLAA
jgi:hypothetical protein